MEFAERMLIELVFAVQNLNFQSCLNLSWYLRFDFAERITS